MSNRPVTELILERLPYTGTLALVAIGLAALVGALLGTAAALKAGTLADTALMGGAALGLAVPTFWSAMLLMMAFALRLRWLPVVGAESWQYIILPAVTLALPTGAVVARMIRASLLDVYGADYVRTAHAKGLSPHRVLAHHIVRNSLIPVVTVLGLHLGHLLGGGLYRRIDLWLAWIGTFDGSGHFRSRLSGRHGRDADGVCHLPADKFPNRRGTRLARSPGRA